MDDALTLTEAAIFGPGTSTSVRASIDGYLRARTGATIADVLFRAGRIDAVWGIRLSDGPEVVVKAHRQPVDWPGRRVTVIAQRQLAAAGFPCPRPISGPDAVGKLVLSVETLLSDGSPGSGRTPAIRRLVAAGLAQHIDILRCDPDLASVAGPGPAWCRYQGGPWPTPHDPIFDFTTTPVGYERLDEFARAAADRLMNANGGPTVVGHADWYPGNLRFGDDLITATFDWDVMAGSEAVIAGMAAACHADAGTTGGLDATPQELAAFLIDYDAATRTPFDVRQQQVAAAAAAWVLAYNAGCALTLVDGEPTDDSPLTLARSHGRDYLDLRW